MGNRVRIFLDYWNFQLNWNQRSDKRRCDWGRLADVLMESCAVLVQGTTAMNLDYMEMRIYASVSAASGSEERLKRWLDQFLNTQRGYRVETRKREEHEFVVRCRTCARQHSRCSCGQPFAKSIEKGVDAAIVTDLLGLAWEGAYDIAILVSSDGDFVPAVEHVQRKGLRVVNARWSGQGHNLAKACWASFSLDELIDKLTLPSGSAMPDEPLIESVSLDETDAFVAEVARAVSHFETKGGFLGVSYFLHRWKSPCLPLSEEERRHLLSQACSRRLLEVVEVTGPDGRPVNAIRVKRQES